MTADHDEDLLLRFARIVAAGGYERGLQPVQWQALTFLARANRFSRTAKALTAWLDQTKGSVSQTINTLEAKGLISRRPDPMDQRISRIELTDVGRELVDAPPPNIAATMLTHLAPNERKAFISLVGKMMIGTIEHRGGRPFGLCRNCKFFEPASSEHSSHRCAALDVPLSDDESFQICYEQAAA